MKDAHTPGEPSHQVVRAVAALFVPGNRPDRFDKALAAGADVIIIDWEDAVAPDQKRDARAHTTTWVLANPQSQTQVVVRINASDTPEHGKDLEALTKLRLLMPEIFPAVMLAKSENPEALGELVNLCGSPITVCALIESAVGLDRANTLAAVPGVERLAFGALDFSLDTGMDPGPDVMAFARQQIVLASRIAGIHPPLDSPDTTISDTEAMYQSSVSARRYGMAGKLCIHPNQVEPIMKGFSPSPEQITWAKSVIGAGLDATQIDGRMVDRPVIERARQILERQEKPR
jgi:citrate lyase subunit beta/citryl-CoA lyase